MTDIPDIINGIFETCGSLFILISIIKLYRDKAVKGVSWIHAGFFAAWGFWNLFYYPHLDQWLSFYGGIAIVVANSVWLGQLIYYSTEHYRRGNRRGSWSEFCDGMDGMP